VIRFALFGAGRIGRVHADSIDVHPQAELAWVYDPIESAAAPVVQRDSYQGRPEYLYFFLDRYTPAYRAELDHLITAMEQGEQPSPGFAAGRKALALADAALESLRTGRRVQVS
jgi:predicted dehydrogenase